VGAASGTGLKSLKYKIFEIGICDHPLGDGASYSGCLALYQSPNAPMNMGPPGGDLSGTAGDARTNGGYTNLLDPAQRATLSTPVTLDSSAARSYVSGYIKWWYAMKFSAELTQPGATVPYLYTHDGATMMSQGGLAPYTTLSNIGLVAPPAEEAVAVFDNGGTNFNFQAPFVIRPEDITNQTSFVVDLLFDPDGIVQSFAGAPTPLQGSVADKLGNQIYMPYLSLTPLAHRHCEQVVREVYLGTVGLDVHQFSLRVELFYLASDPQKGIYGANVTALVSSATERPYQVPKVASVSVAPDGTVQLLDEQQNTLIAGLLRRATLGASSAASFGCQATVPEACTAPVPVSLVLQRLDLLPQVGTCTCKSGQDCGTGQVCVAGTCVSCGGAGTNGLACPNGFLCCGSSCLDPSANSGNCGACGATCAAGNTCAAGKCTCGSDGRTCAPGTSACSPCAKGCGSGACACASSADCPDPNEVCQGGSCVACSTATAGNKCKSGLSCCGKCVDTTIDPQNCGGCGMTCSASHVLAAACVKGACKPACTPGYADCGGTNDGCETQMDDTHCGSCQTMCTASNTCSLALGYRCALRSNSGCSLDYDCASAHCVNNICQ
jgi:hypothetical protein